MRWFRIAMLLIGAAMSMLGCVGPVVNKMTPDFPATVLNIVGNAPVVDGRERFREIFCRMLTEESDYQGPAGQCEQFLFKFNDEPLSSDPPLPLTTPKARYRILIVPGFLNECFSSIALPFEDAIAEIDDPQFKFEHLVVSGRSSSDVNAADIDHMIAGLNLDKNEKLVLVGHSKGVADILHFLHLFPQTASRVSAVVSIAGAINGSRLAGIAGLIFDIQVQDILSRHCEPGDDMALHDLRPAVSMSWLANNPLPDSALYFSIAAFTSRDNVNTILKTGHDLLSIYDSRNDGVLLISDQIIPGGTLLGYVNTDHLSVALPLENKHYLISSTIQAPQKFPRKVLLRAVLGYLVEVLALDSEKVQIEN